MSSRTDGNETQHRIMEDSNAEAPTDEIECPDTSTDTTSPTDYSDELSSEDASPRQDGHDMDGTDREELNERLEENQAHYSDEGFWNKAKKYAKKAGEKTMSPALKMYYSAQDPDTPRWAKSTMYGALGYFILPVDAIPDITPIAGYTDDIGILAGAIGVVTAHIKDEHVEQAKQALTRWFG